MIPVGFREEYFKDLEDMSSLGSLLPHEVRKLLLEIFLKNSGKARCLTFSGRAGLLAAGRWQIMACTPTCILCQSRPNADGEGRDVSGNKDFPVSNKSLQLWLNAL